MSGLSSNRMEDLLNPDVYLNHLPSLEAQQIEISRDIVVFVLGATIWDILVHIRDDIKIVSRSNRLSPVMFCFVISRITAVIHVFLDSMERMTPITHLYALEIASGCLLSISAASSSYLFLQRAQAVCSEQIWLQRVFFIAWLLLLGASCLVPPGLHPSYIPGTCYYRDSGLATYVAVAPWFVFLFDTCVFVAISYRIAREHNYTGSLDHTAEPRASWFFKPGRRLPPISKTILRGGQQYYLITVGTIVLAAIGLSLPSNLQLVGATFPIIMIPLSASMACRVFRNLKLLEAEDCRTFNAPIV